MSMDKAVSERIEGKRQRDAAPNDRFAETEKSAQKVDLLIDIQEKIQAGYERWAKTFNLKQAAQTLIFLQEHKLAEATAQATKRFTELSAEIKTRENRMAEITELQKTISTYSRTRDIYKQYREAGYCKNFVTEHEGDIILHQAAKKAFDKLGLKKIPTIASLKQEYAKLLAEKKKLYSEYRDARDQMRSLVNAKANADTLLRGSQGGIERENDDK